MKKLLFFLVLILFVTSCRSNDEDMQKDYVFVSEYTTTITVGGFVGIMERTFEIGKTYKVINQENGMIAI